MKFLNVRVDRLSLSKARWKRKVKDENTTELAESIRKHGILQPILGRRHNGKIEILDGAHRLAAAKKAGIEIAPIMLKELDDSDGTMSSIETGLKRYKLTNEERAKAILKYKELWEKEHGKTQRGGDRRSADAKQNGTGGKPNFEKDAAKRFGYSRASINKVVNRKNNLDPKVERALEDEEITAEHADELKKLPRERQCELLSKVLKGDLTRDQTREIVAAEKRTVGKGKTSDQLKRSLSMSASHAKKLSAEIAVALRLIDKLKEKAPKKLKTIQCPDELRKADDSLVAVRKALKGRGAASSPA